MFDHAIQISTKGILGSTVGLSSKGYIVRITDIPIPTKRTTGPGMRGFRKEESKRIIKVCVEAYGEKFYCEEVVRSGGVVKISNIEIVELGDNKIRVGVINVN